MRSTLLLLLALSAPAAAYTFTGSTWSWQDHAIEDPWTLAVSDFPTDAGTTAEIEAAFTNAMATWNAEPVDLELQYAGTGSASLQPDGHSVISYGEYPGLGSTLAFAGTWAYDDGAAFDCDLYFLSESDQGTVYWDADPAGPAAGRYGIEEVALHELGHCLGLGHSASASAVMYAYYSGTATLTADDAAGVAALYPPACADADGDGYLGCDTDCDDRNAAIHPGTVEVCDGVDGDCNGLVDDSPTETLTLADRGVMQTLEWQAAADVVTANAATALLRFSRGAEMDVGTRLVWAVHETTDGGTTWTLLRSEISQAIAGDTQTSPALHLPLVAGHTYAFSLGGMTSSAVVRVDSTPDLSPRGLVTPLGATLGRALADDLGPPDPEFLFVGSYELASAPDADGDGVTALCGDCAPDDPAIHAGAVERCDGIDQDCDNVADEDFAVDVDADGTYDCLDPCPTDPTDACLDTGGDDTALPTDTDDSGSQEEPAPPGAKDPASCGCSAALPRPAGFALGAALLFQLRRRRRA